MNSKRIRIPSFASQLATLRNSSTGTQLQSAPMYFLLPLPSVYSFQWTVRGTQRYQEKLLFKNEIRHLPFPLSSTLYPNCSLSAGPTCHPMTSPWLGILTAAAPLNGEYNIDWPSSESYWCSSFVRKSHALRWRWHNIILPPPPLCTAQSIPLTTAGAAPFPSGPFRDNKSNQFSVTQFLLYLPPHHHHHLLYRLLLTTHWQIYLLLLLLPAGTPSHNNWRQTR